MDMTTKYASQHFVFGVSICCPPAYCYHILNQKHYFGRSLAKLEMFRTDVNKTNTLYDIIVYNHSINRSSHLFHLSDMC